MCPPPLPIDGLLKATILGGVTYGKNSGATVLCNFGVHLKASEVTVPIKAKELYLR